MSSRKGGPKIEKDEEKEKKKVDEEEEEEEDDESDSLSVESSDGAAKSSGKKNGSALKRRREQVREASRRFRERKKSENSIMENRIRELEMKLASGGKKEGGGGEGGSGSGAGSNSNSSSSSSTSTGVRDATVTKEASTLRAQITALRKENTNLQKQLVAAAAAQPTNAEKGEKGEKGGKSGGTTTSATPAVIPTTTAPAGTSTTSIADKNEELAHKLTITESNLSQALSLLRQVHAAACRASTTISMSSRSRTTTTTTTTVIDKSDSGNGSTASSAISSPLSSARVYSPASLSLLVNTAAEVLAKGGTSGGHSNNNNNNNNNNDSNMPASPSLVQVGLNKLLVEQISRTLTSTPTPAATAAAVAIVNDTVLKHTGNQVDGKGSSSAASSSSSSSSFTHKSSSLFRSGVGGGTATSDNSKNLMVGNGSPRNRVAGGGGARGRSSSGRSGNTNSTTKSRVTTTTNNNNNNNDAEVESHDPLTTTTTASPRHQGRMMMMMDASSISSGGASGGDTAIMNVNDGASVVSAYGYQGFFSSSPVANHSMMMHTTGGGALLLPHQQQHQRQDINPSAVSAEALSEVSVKTLKEQKQHQQHLAVCIDLLDAAHKDICSFLNESGWTLVQELLVNVTAAQLRSSTSSSSSSSLSFAAEPMISGGITSDTTAANETSKFSPALIRIYVRKSDWPIFTYKVEIGAPNVKASTMSSVAHLRVTNHTIASALQNFNHDDDAIMMHSTTATAASSSSATTASSSSSPSPSPPCIISIETLETLDEDMATSLCTIYRRDLISSLRPMNGSNTSSSTSAISLVPLRDFVYIVQNFAPMGVEDLTRYLGEEHATSLPPASSVDEFARLHAKGKRTNSHPYRTHLEKKHQHQSDIKNGKEDAVVSDNYNNESSSNSSSSNTKRNSSVVKPVPAATYDTKSRLWIGVARSIDHLQIPATSSTSVSTPSSVGVLTRAEVYEGWVAKEITPPVRDDDEEKDGHHQSSSASVLIMMGQIDNKNLISTQGIADIGALARMSQRMVSLGLAIENGTLQGFGEDGNPHTAFGTTAKTSAHHVEPSDDDDDDDEVRERSRGVHRGRNTTTTPDSSTANPHYVYITPSGSPTPLSNAFSSTSNHAPSSFPSSNINNNTHHHHGDVVMDNRQVGRPSKTFKQRNTHSAVTTTTTASTTTASTPSVLLTPLHAPVTAIGVPFHMPVLNATTSHLQHQYQHVLPPLPLPVVLTPSPLSSVSGRNSVGGLVFDHQANINNSSKKIINNNQGSKKNDFSGGRDSVNTVVQSEDEEVDNSLIQHHHTSHTAAPVHVAQQRGTEGGTNEEEREEEEDTHPRSQSGLAGLLNAIEEHFQEEGY